MKTSLRVLAALFVFASASFVLAGDFISQIVQGSVPPTSFTINVPGDRFLKIRNFTQQGTFSAITIRGQITAMDSTGLSGTVLTATIADTDPLTQLEPVNEVVIAGPSTVTVTGGDTTCIITYRLGDD